MKHIMLDLETMGTSYNAAIVAIGACEFDPCNPDAIGAKYYRIVSLQSSMDAGSNIDAGTVMWWMQQSPAAQGELITPTAVSLKEALNCFSNWLLFAGVSVSGKDIAIWGNGATFDNVVIRSAYKAVGLDVPWSFRNDKCYRTVINLLPEAQRPEFVRYGTAHNALDDAITQALHLQKVYKLLGLASA